MTDNEKMREVPPITDETYKALMVALGMPNNRSLLSALQQIANRATQRAAWQASQSVPPRPDYSVTQLQRMKSLMGVLGLATDESLEAFCLDADRQLSRVITAMEKFMAKQAVPVVGEPVAWGVTKRYEDNVWFISDSRFTAQDYAQMYAHRIGENLDQVVIPLYKKPAASITAAELERLRKDAARYQIVRDSTYCDVHMHEIYLNDTDLDAAIDAAIAAEGTGNG